ncbi:MAG: DNA topoisomerase [Clostridiaceae bacterium]|nr:DNA topoisomerase [Clostridiaceae bacterium]
MKKLIISEKPSLARNVAVGTKERFEKKDGYMESEHYVITWGFGHLFGLKDVEEYQPDYSKDKKYPWKLDMLPFYPSQFEFTLKKSGKETDPGVEHQFEVIRQLLGRQDISCVIHNGDADREGEVIVRLILQHAGYRGKVLRLWEDDQSPQTLAVALQKELKDDREFDAVADEGYARTYMDWLYGINLTRYVTLKAGGLLRVGRVINAIVKAIYDRDMEIQNFQPEKYFSIVGTDANGLKVVVEKHIPYGEQAYAKEALKKYQGRKAVVQGVTKETKNLAPKKLYSITKLQGDMGKKYKYTPDMTLSCVQKLYEQGYVSYPRTSSECLSEGDKENIREILSMWIEKGEDVQFQDKKSIFNDEKVISHGALVPTKKIPASLSDGEEKTYQMILARFLANFCSQPCQVSHTTVSLQIGTESYEVKGKQLVQCGWQKYEQTEKDATLPDLLSGQELQFNYVLEEKKTTPPKHYTTETLNNYMENPFRKEKSEASDDYLAIINGLQIGTGATRAPIISNAIHNGYISLEKDTYRILEKGIFMIQTLEQLGISLDSRKTVELNSALTKVANGQITVQECIDITKHDIDQCIQNRDQKVKQLQTRERTAVGKCPVCGKDVYESEKSFYCSGYRDGCKFSIWKNDKYMAALRKKVTPGLVRNLLEKGKISLKMKTRGKKEYLLSLKYVQRENGYWGWEKI